MSIEQQIREKMEQPDRAEFWSKVAIATNENWEVDGTDFINSVQVADMFADATKVSAVLANEAEVIAEILANLDYEIAKQERALGKFRRSILAEHYGSITKSASAEIQDAFILAMAIAGGKGDTLLEMERELERLVVTKEKLVPRQEKVKFRLRTLEKNLDWAKQFLDFDKLMTRVHQGARA